MSLFWQCENIIWTIQGQSAVCDCYEHFHDWIYFPVSITSYHWVVHTRYKNIKIGLGPCFLSQLCSLHHGGRYTSRMTHQKCPEFGWLVIFYFLSSLLNSYTLPSFSFKVVFVDDTVTFSEKVLPKLFYSEHTWYYHEQKWAWGLQQQKIFCVAFQEVGWRWCWHKNS